MYYEDLGPAVAALRKEKGLTQKELADKIGMGQSTLARFEKGRVREFGSRKLLSLLGALGYRVEFTKRRPFTLDDALRERQQEAGNGW